MRSCLNTTLEDVQIERSSNHPLAKATSLAYFVSKWGREAVRGYKIASVQTDGVGARAVMERNKSVRKVRVNRARSTSQTHTTIITLSRGCSEGRSSSK